MYCKLTPDDDGNWGAPVAKVIGPAQWVKEYVGNQRVSAMPEGWQRANGYRSFGEQRVNDNFVRGAAVDIIEWATVTRTYPNATLKPDADLKAVTWAKLSAERSRFEQQGVVVGGIKVATDPESQAKITGAIERVKRKPGDTLQFKTKTGAPAAMNKAALDAVFDAVADHVQRSYDVYATHYAAIDALTGQAILDYDVFAGWEA